MPDMITRPPHIDRAARPIPKLHAAIRHAAIRHGVFPGFIRLMILAAAVIVGPLVFGPLVFGPLVYVTSAQAAMTLQITPSITVSFEDGNLDVATGSGDMSGVTIIEGGQTVLSAETVTIKASGKPGNENWIIHYLQLKNAVFPAPRIFVNDLALREVNAGLLVSDWRESEIANIMNDASFFSARNISIEAENALISIDEVTTLPIAFAEIAPGQRIATDAGLRITGMTAMPVRDQKHTSSLLRAMAARGFSDFTIDMELDMQMRVAGDDVHIFYNVSSAMRGLAEVEFALSMIANRDVYADLLPSLADSKTDPGTALEMSGLIALEQAEMMVTDLGLGNILLAAAGEDEGISSDELRRSVRMATVQRLTEIFPENGPEIAVPVDAFLEQGGTLDLALRPDVKVPFIKFVGLALLPDLALEALGFEIGHSPD